MLLIYGTVLLIVMVGYALYGMIKPKRIKVATRIIRRLDIIGHLMFIV